MNGDLRALAEAATPGEWGVVGSEGRGLNPDPYSSRMHVGCERPEDAAYIAAVHPAALLALLDERDALAAKVARVEALHSGMYTSVAYIDGAPLQTDRCPACHEPAPCPTRAALEGKS